MWTGIKTICLQLCLSVWTDLQTSDYLTEHLRSKVLAVGWYSPAAAALLHFTLRRTVTYFSCTLALITKWRYYFLPSPYQLLWVIHNGPE